MSNYNDIERYLARALSKFPVIKHFAKSVYSRFVYFFERKPFRYKALSKPVVCAIDQKASFFGYYDKVPENSAGFILCHVAQHSTSKKPTESERVEIVVLDQALKPLVCALSNAYNWQQGCRAQWLSDSLFIFNDFDTRSRDYVSRVYSVDSGAQVKKFDYPVQDSFGTEYFLSINYRRLMALSPDYGYRNLPPLTTDKLKELSDDGIWRVEFSTGRARLLLSLEKIYDFSPSKEFTQALHSLNHVMISPNGQFFIVIHRFFIGERRFDRLLLVNSESGSPVLLSDYGMVSHCFWLDDNHVLGFLRGPSKTDGYWLIDVRSGQFSPVLQDALASYGDGHPHVNGDWFVTDTYPDKSRMQHLLLCNWKTGEMRELGEFYHGFGYSGESRCDLHPRLSSDGQSVFFDSVFSGKRRLYRMEISS